jgi:hypothetical protein
MTLRRTAALIGVTLACASFGASSRPDSTSGSAPILAASGTAVRQAASQLPARLTNEEFWALSRDASEPDGYFRSDNLTSNELLFQHVIPDLVSRTSRGGVYLGVGPEQNYTYIAELEPPLVVIFDIRRGNMLLQLMYKAVFELSTDRADFVAMLFSRPRPAGLTPASTAADLFGAFARVGASDALFKRNLKAITAHLTGTRGIPLAAADLDGIQYVFSSFYQSGFALRSSPTYAELMTATDAAGLPRSYLASEQRFLVLKALQEKNLVVPVVGDFGGPKAIRTVGSWLRARGATVAAFYLSNVEQYLVDGKWEAFCRNVATLPLTSSSTFIRSSSGGSGGGRGFVSSLGAMADETRACR